jgi:hypothetical protein
MPFSFLFYFFSLSSSSFFDLKKPKKVATFQKHPGGARLEFNTRKGLKKSFGDLKLED